MVVYCKAIFPHLVCWKIIYHLRIIAMLWEMWSCSFRPLVSFLPTDGKCDTRQSNHQRLLTYHFDDICCFRTTRLYLTSNKKTYVCVYTIGIIGYVE